LATLPQAQGTPPATPLMLIAREGRRPVPTTLLSGQELIALDDVAALFQVTVREDALAGAITVSHRGRTIVISADQPMASVDGRIVSLPSPAVRSGRRWLVPVEFLPRALGPIYDQRIELRRASRLLVVGDARVPRVTARIDAIGPPTRATVEVSPAAPVSVSADDSRVILRVDGDALDLALPASGGGLIEQIRAADPNTVTIALAPSAGTPRAVPSTSENTTRIALEIPSELAAAEPAPAPARPAAPAEPPPLPPPRAAFQTVVIDPGHGGDDAGVRAAGGLDEKELTLDVARRLRGLLEARLGLRVLLTRDDDRTLGLDERAAVANNNKADLFVSLHANAALVPSMAGAEVLYLRVDRQDEDGRDGTEPAALPVLGGGFRTVDIVRWDLAQIRHLERSAAFAGMLEEELRRRVPVSPRAVQQAPMRVLAAANMPAALVEMAYLTNPDQARRAASEEFREAVAQAVFEAIVRFRAWRAAEPPS
ncbi:MAG TPA: N-acetylmuramoyl-L-alanine amidase, partial [Vicinamibacterales bacterium]|nr:N-acetylmuramoyl-L-alanine amidase [Vicinamibacterales bacterium]